MPSGASKWAKSWLWFGPCMAGQKPGDMIMPNGMKMNVLEPTGGRNA